ncbi:hypothetical protein ACK8P5_26665 (plasmid) [Paenibacillus sp. EC2-1]|uniref:hypothetical protein n=1 Tax=Paenibacillus sp. EC2-1 TaxID=3388665 RepID=UPI003BEEBFE5
MEVIIMPFTHDPDDFYNTNDQAIDDLSGDVQDVHDRPITSTQVGIVEKLHEVIDGLRSGLTPKELERSISYLESLGSYLEVLHHETALLREVAKAPEKMIDDIKRVHKIHTDAALDEARLNHIGNRRGINMKDYNTGCIDTLELLNRNLTDIKERHGGYEYDLLDL